MLRVTPRAPRQARDDRAHLRSDLDREEVHQPGLHFSISSRGNIGLMKAGTLFDTAAYNVRRMHV